MRIKVIPAGMFLILVGCAAKHPHFAHPPNSKLEVVVPAGCYKQEFPDHLEIRCPDITYKVRSK